MGEKRYFVVAFETNIGFHFLANVRAATERTIALVKERSVALIAAVVTGQLNVEASG